MMGMAFDSMPPLFFVRVFLCRNFWVSLFLLLLFLLLFIFFHALLFHAFRSILRIISDFVRVFSKRSIVWFIANSIRYRNKLLVRNHARLIQ